MSRGHVRWVLPISLLLALLLGLVPLPPLLQPLRPYWLALVVAYWTLEVPERMGMAMAFALGVLADLAFGSLLGEQALRLSVMVFILDRFRPRLRFFPMWQRALAIGALLLNDKVVTAAIHLVIGAPQLPVGYWLAPLLGMALWPLLFVALDSLRTGRRR